MRWLWVLIACGCYHPASALPCTVSCDFAADQACPGGLACLADNLCHVPGHSDCSSGDDGGPDSPPGMPNLMFVTSQPVSIGTLGVDGANTACMTAAMMGGWPGTYHAWLASAGVPAQQQLATARGWLRVDGKPFVDSIPDLVGGQILYPPRIDEMTGDHPDDTVSVATAADGNGDLINDCTGFTGVGMITAGRPDGTTHSWTNLGGQPCSNMFHLYCFGIDRNSPLQLAPPTGKLAFVTAAPFGISVGGIDDADTLCRNEATAAQLTGTFRALLATTTATAGSRVGPGPWSRVDGVSIGTLDEPLAPLNVQATGGYITGPVWTGAADPNSLGTATCGDWKVASGGEAGSSTRSNPAHIWSEGTDNSHCASGLPIRCLQM